MKKKLAVYYTKPAISILISSLLIKSPYILILDPSCGSGTLLNAAYHTIEQLTKRKNFNSVLIGVEIYEKAYNEAKILEQKNTSEINIKIIHDDIFFVFEELQNKYFQIEFNKALNTKSLQYIILANPPFSKSQNLSSEYKKNICNVLKLENFSSLGLHCYFLNLIYQILPNKGRFGIILPITISYTNQGLDLVKEFFLKTKITHIIISEIETAFSVDSNFQEIIIIGQKNELKDNLKNKITIISLKKIVKIESAEFLADAIEKIYESSKNEFFSHYTLLQKNLTSKIGLEGWNFLYRTEKLNLFLQSISKNLIPIEFEKDIQKKRGINVPTDFFFIPNKYFEIEIDTENVVQMKLRTAFQDSFEKRFHEIKLKKIHLISLIRKPEFYKDRIKILDENIYQNYCLKINENCNDIELKNYIIFGEKILANKRSNTANLNEKWYLASNNYISNGNLFLTFKWDPRYRSFLVNYSNTKNTIASQAFWVLNVINKRHGYEDFLLSWLNSSISMGLIYGLADVQRRVWRQLAGNRIRSIKIIPLEYYTRLSKKDQEAIESFNNKIFNSNLIVELEEAIESITMKSIDTNKRVQVDLLFLSILLSAPRESLFETLKVFYNELKQELAKVTNI